MKLKAFFSGRRRREYAPFGESWKFSARYEAASFIIFLVFTVFAIAIFTLSKDATIVICGISVYILILLLIAYEFKDNIYSLIALGSLSEEDYELLCREYREFKEKNIIRYGIITSYGIVSDDGMLPWNKITRIKVTPKERRYTHKGGVKTVSAKIRYYASIGGKLSISLSQKRC